MIHTYNEQYLSLIQVKLATMFELAVLYEHLAIDDFATTFVSSNICPAFESGDPVVVLGKSANELLGLLLNKDPLEIETDSSASPEYWVGWVLAYAQWYFNKPYRTILASLSCSKLLEYYFPYHEMDITASMEMIKKHLDSPSSLKERRQGKKLSQTQLSLLSNVPLRSIKAYEQGTVDISKAQGETLYALAKVLGCTIEDLIT